MRSLKNAAKMQQPGIKLKKFFTILFLFFTVMAIAQTEEQKLTNTMKELHQAMVNRNLVSVNQQTDKALSYGHSNGYIETKELMMKNLQTGYLTYSSFREDSVNSTINNNMANVRFVADINAQIDGHAGTYHLKVLEVWVKKGKRWLLFARQAVK
jgi:hypothetical protein